MKISKRTLLKSISMAMALSTVAGVGSLAQAEEKRSIFWQPHLPAVLITRWVLHWLHWPK